MHATDRTRKEERQSCALDVREDALKNDVIVPGEVEDSEFHYRIHSDDPDEIMPPPESHSALPSRKKNCWTGGLRKEPNMISTGHL